MIGSDIGVLVVSASLGEFRTGMSIEGMTREQASLAFSMGIKELIVCVTKLD
jgi:elongation factor 1-alpha